MQGEPKSLTHHAYLLLGERTQALSYLENLLHEVGFETVGNPDFFLYEEILFGIDDARDLIRRASEKAFGSRKVFFISSERMSAEAENALLKVFEDPFPHTHFFVSVRDEELLESTLRSRMMPVSVRGEANPTSSESDVARGFLSLPLKKRMALAKEFGEGKHNLSLFLDELLTLLRLEKDSQDKLQKVFEARRFSDDRSVLPRIIVEHLAVVL